MGVEWSWLTSLSRTPTFLRGKGVILLFLTTVVARGLARFRVITRPPPRYVGWGKPLPVKGGGLAASTPIYVYAWFTAAVAVACAIARWNAALSE